MVTATIWRYEDADTRPRGFGYPPQYLWDKPSVSGWDCQWADPVEVTIPDGYSFGKYFYGARTGLFDADGNLAEVVDFRGHPAIVVGMGYKLLDNAGGAKR